MAVVVDNGGRGGEVFEVADIGVEKKKRVGEMERDEWTGLGLYALE